MTSYRCKFQNIFSSHIFSCWERLWVSVALVLLLCLHCLSSSGFLGITSGRGGGHFNWLSSSNENKDRDKWWKSKAPWDCCSTIQDFTDLVWFLLIFFSVSFFLLPQKMGQMLTVPVQSCISTSFIFSSTTLSDVLSQNLLTSWQSSATFLPQHTKHEATQRVVSLS